MLGTPRCLSPEQALGRGATPASDLDALGVVAHELLPGRRPFDRETPVATALAHVTEPMPTLPAAVPSDLIDIVSRCLSKEPEGRPTSAREIAPALGVPESEATIPSGSPASGTSVACGPVISKPARFVDLLVGPRARVLVLASGVGRTARDFAALGHRVVGADEDELLGLGPAALHPRVAPLDRAALSALTPRLGSLLGPHLSSASRG